jgi:nucleoside phosphorylase
MGMPAAAVLATKMVRTFRPRFIAIVGIAAGVKDRSKIGDVIVADPCWDWGSGKWTLDGSETAFRPAPHQVGLNPRLREQFRLLANDTQSLVQIRDRWPAAKPDAAVVLHIGPMASGAAVLSDGVTARRVLEQHRQLLAIDMESYGVYSAAAESPSPSTVAFGVKTVVDYADADKDDRFQAYGAYMSANVTAQIAERYLGSLDGLAIVG